MALTQESVLSFLLERGGKVKNSELLNNFRGLISCSDPAEKQHNRDLFKKLVNSVAVVKQIDEVKFVVVKKRYQDFVREVVGDGCQMDDSVSSQNSSFSCTSPAHRAESNRRIHSDIENNNVSLPAQNDDYKGDSGRACAGGLQERTPNSSSVDATTVKVLNITADQARKSGAVFAVIAVKSPPKDPPPQNQDGLHCHMHDTSRAKISNPCVGQNLNFQARKNGAQSGSKTTQGEDPQPPPFPHARPPSKTPRKDGLYSPVHQFNRGVTQVHTPPSEQNLNLQGCKNGAQSGSKCLDSNQAEPHLSPPMRPPSKTPRQDGLHMQNQQSNRLVHQASKTSSKQNMNSPGDSKIRQEEDLQTPLSPHMRPQNKTTRPWEDPNYSGYVQDGLDSHIHQSNMSATQLSNQSVEGTPHFSACMNINTKCLKMRQAEGMKTPLTLHMRPPDKTTRHREDADFSEHVQGASYSQSEQINNCIAQAFQQPQVENLNVLACKNGTQSDNQSLKTRQVQDPQTPALPPVRTPNKATRQGDAAKSPERVQHGLYSEMTVKVSEQSVQHLNFPACETAAENSSKFIKTRPGEDLQTPVYPHVAPQNKTTRYCKDPKSSECVHDGLYSQVHQSNKVATKVTKPLLEQNLNFPGCKYGAQSDPQSQKTRQAEDAQPSVFPHLRPQNKATRQGDDGKYSESVPLEPLAHEWLVKCAAGLWGQIHGLLLQDTRLVQKKDFMSGFTALHWAAKDGNSEMIHKLVNICRKKGTCVNINCKAHGGYTPLHIAAIHGQTKVMVLLVKSYGANVNERDNDGKKAVHYLGKGVPAEVRALLGGRQQRQKTEEEDFREQTRGFNTISKLFQPNMGKKQKTTKYAQDW